MVRYVAFDRCITTTQTQPTLTTWMLCYDTALKRNTGYAPRLEKVVL